ncbi:MAG: lysylphosphatidylglycerol synthase transmembrane domain-containing protein [Acidobacteriota bacterium]|nr:lysylphosphatidylglycerol synthase transmembrane domain-containing protein [Acidobacteriota bacterium]
MTKQFKAIFILIVGAGLLYWFFSRLDWTTVGSHLRSAHIWPLVLAAILINLTLVARSLRWQAFLSPIAKVSLSNLIAATAVGFGGLFVIGRAAEIIRPTVLSLREKLQPSATFATILIERIYDTVTVVTSFSICLLLFELPPDQAAAWQKVGGTKTFGTVLLVGIITGVLVLLLLRLKAEPILAWFSRQSSHLPKKLAQPILNFLKHLADGLSILLNVKELIVTIFYTLVVWGLITSATWLTLYAFGLNFSIMQIIFILGFGLVGSVVPTPGGSAGAFHAAAAKALEFLGTDPNLSASVAIVYHLIAFGPPFVMGLYYLIRHDISFHQLREMIASESKPQALTQN